MTNSLMDGERRRWDRQDEWAATARLNFEPSSPLNKIRSGFDEALRERAYQQSFTNRLAFNPYARRK